MTNTNARREGGPHPSRLTPHPSRKGLGVRGKWFALLALAIALSGCAVLEPRPVRMDVSCIVVSHEPFILNCADTETWREWKRKQGGQI